MFQQLHGRIFISHSHVDARLAGQLDAALSQLLGNRIEIARSSRPGQVPGGTAWRDWIYDELSRSDFAFVVLTHASCKSDWVLCETGMFSAIARTRTDFDLGGLDALVPLTFLYDAGDLPGPLQTHKAILGTGTEDIRNTFRSVLLAYSGLIGAERAGEGRERLGSIVDSYVQAAKKDLGETPQDQSEELVQDWLARFDELMSKGRTAEAKGLRKLAQIAFGGAEGDGRPLDFRLHRRFGDLYFQENELPEAIKEYRAALKRAPRDVFLMHRLALMIMNNKSDPGRLHEAIKVIERIHDLDNGIVPRNAELSALWARYEAERGQFQRASDLVRAYVDYDKSFYTLNNAAIYSMLAVGLTPAVLGDFQRCLDFLRSSRNAPDFWDLATELNCLLALGHLDEAAGRLSKLRQYGRSGPEFESAAKYFDEIINQRRKIDSSPALAAFDWLKATAVPADAVHPRPA